MIPYSPEVLFSVVYLEWNQSEELKTSSQQHVKPSTVEF